MQDKSLFDNPRWVADHNRVVKINRCLDVILHWTSEAMNRGDHERVRVLDARYCAVEDQLYV